MEFLALVRLILKILALALAAWLAFMLVGSTLPYLLHKEVSEIHKEAFASQSFYGDGTPGPDRATVIETPTDAFGVRLALAQSATQTLDITNHLVKDSQATRAFLGEVLAAADRGVTVRLLLDGFGQTLDRPLMETLKTLAAHPGISVRLYNPPHPLQPWNLHALLHDKFIIVDSEVLLLGGRNFDERHYAPSGFNRPTTHDRNVLVWKEKADSEQNPSAIGQVQTYMEALWEFKYTRPLAPAHAEEAEHYLGPLRQAAAAFPGTDPAFYEKTLPQYLEATLPTSRITLLANPIHTFKKEPLVGYGLSQLALSAQESVTLQTPYATGNRRLLSVLSRVADKVPLTILTNSLYSTPNLPAFSNYYGQRTRFLSTGATLYEYQRADSIHAKSLIIDGRLSAVGSFNMDDRSFYIDTETMLIIDSPAFAQQLAGVMQNVRAASLRVGPDNQYVPDEAVPTPQVPLVKRYLILIVFVLLRPFQFLL